MTKVYPAIIHEENGSYWVEFPDLEGCSTYGETLEETLDPIFHLLSAKTGMRSTLQQI